MHTLTHSKESDLYTTRHGYEAATHKAEAEALAMLEAEAKAEATTSQEI